MNRKPSPNVIPEPSTARDVQLAISQHRVFETAADLFSILATPVRLKIISAVCQGEKSVSQLLESIGTRQSNMSQHLAALYRCGILAKRREGTQIYYRVQSERIALLCRAVCTQAGLELDRDSGLSKADRIVPLPHR